MSTIALARLLRLASPALPVGAFSYSQGLEWAVESGTVRDEASAQQWIGSLLAGNMARFELPMLAGFYGVWRESAGSNSEAADSKAANMAAAAAEAARLNEDYLASRETAELRAESVQMGRALRTVLVSDGELDDAVLQHIEAIESLTFPNSFAFAAAHWNVELTDTLTGYVWSWLENQMTAAIKLVPLGQSAGQRMLMRLTSACVNAVETALSLPNAHWSNFSPLFAIACSRHETQYTRLFRS